MLLTLTTKALAIGDALQYRCTEFGANQNYTGSKSAAEALCTSLSTNLTCQPGNQTATSSIPNGTKITYTGEWHDGNGDNAGVCTTEFYECGTHASGDLYFSHDHPNITGVQPGCALIPTCDTGEIFDEQTEQCILDCTWPEVYDSISDSCEIYDDCSPGEVPHPTNEFVCIPDDCQSGDSTFITYGTYWGNKPSDISVSIPSPLCVGICEANPANVEVVTTWPGGGCGTFNNEQVCTEPTGYSVNVTATKTGASCSGDTPAPACPSCSSPPDPGSQPDAPQDDPEPNPDPLETQPNSGPTDETSTTVDNGDGTTTTTTTTTYGDGSTTTTTTNTTTATGNTTSSTTTTAGQSENEDGPEKERQYSGGGCSTKPLCSGDAIDCAIAGHVWETKCALDTEGVTIDETALETEIGSTDLETLLDGGEVDASDPLSIGGYVETAAPSCPAGITVNFLDTTETMDWTFMCQFMLLARPIVHAVGLFLALTIFYRGVIREA